MSRYVGALAGASALGILALWLVPPVGFVAVVVLLVLMPPWGRSLTERAIVSGMVALGVIALAFPRAGATPVTQVGARLTLTVVVLLALGTRLVPALREVRIPRPTLADGLVLALAVLSSWWLMAAYVGRSAAEIVSGLFFSGWDNQGHFLTFANTYEVGSTTWPTVDGSVAWNQWYPSLHTTLWSLTQLASSGTSALLDRPGLLWPYVQWSAISFALCLAALAWVAGDLAARLGGRGRERWTRPLAVAGFAAFALLGSPALLFNAGFTNFMMAVTVVVVTAYLSARSLRSARTLGWFLVPVGALCTVGLWTPLVLGLVPSGAVVAVALLRYRRWWAVAWLLASAAAAAVMVATQSAAILGVEPGQSTADFTTDLGSITAGMVAFNLGLALLAPLIAVLAAALVFRSRGWPLAIAILGPVLGAAAVALVFVRGADAAGISRLQSYYVLKPLDAMLLAVVPLIAAFVAVGLTRALAGVPRWPARVGVLLSGVVVVALFGYSGAIPGQLAAGHVPSPGVQAGADRTRGVNDPLLGEAILGAAQAAEPYPEYTTLMWDGAGTLPNLWVSSLHGVMSNAENRFYRGLPPFPYDDKTLGYVDLALNLNPAMRIVVLWFRPSTGELLQSHIATRSDERLVMARIRWTQNVLCPECAS